MRWQLPVTKRRKWYLASGAVALLTVSCGTPSVTDSPSLIPRSPSSTNDVATLPGQVEAATSTKPVALEAEAKDVVAMSFDAVMMRRIECGRQPKQCDVSSLAIPDSPLHERLTALMDQRVQSGIIASRRGSVRYRIDNIVFTDPIQAEVTTCLTDDTVLMSAGGIFDESLHSAITTWSMRQHEGRWLWIEDQVVDWRRGEDLCAFDQ